MHAFGPTNNGIDRAGLNAQLTANTLLLYNNCQYARLVCTALRIQRQRFAAQQPGQASDGLFATWWATINFSFTAVKCRRVIATSRITATGALGLGEPGINSRNGAVGVAGKVWAIWHGASMATGRSECNATKRGVGTHIPRRYTSAMLKKDFP